MDPLEILRLNVLSPMTLAFVLGIIAVVVKSDLKIPEQVYSIISIYLLFSIGLEGGFDLAESSFADFIGPALAAIAIGAAIPLWSYVMLTRFAALGPADAIAVGLHFGAVSSVTLSAAITFLDEVGEDFEGFLPTLYVIMELPAIIVALVMSAVFVQRRRSEAEQAEIEEKQQTIGDVARLALTGKTFMLLGGGVMIGLLSGEAGKARVEPFFFDLFAGFLTLFLLEMGTLVGERLDELKEISLGVWIYSTAAPVVNAFAAVLLGTLAGLSPGGATVFASLAAGASFISAPAVAQSNLPQANPGIYLTSAMVIAFPFNIVLGIPLYFEFAVRMA